MVEYSRCGEFSLIEGSDSLLTAFLNAFSLLFLPCSHESGVLVDDVIRGGIRGSTRVVSGESGLGCGDIEVGKEWGVVRWFGLIVLGVVSQVKVTESSCVARRGSAVPESAELEVAHGIGVEGTLVRELTYFLVESEVLGDLGDVDGTADRVVWIA